MIFQVFIDDQAYPIEVPEHLLRDAEDFFQNIDRDMDGGYQMSRTWVQSPDIVQRCQIAADRILSALHTEKRDVGVMMAAYILARIPGVSGVHLSTEGDMTEHELIINQKPDLHTV